MGDIPVLLAVAGMHFVASVLLATASIKVYEFNPGAGLGFALVSLLGVAAAELVVGSELMWVSPMFYSELVLVSVVSALLGVVGVLMLVDPEPRSFGSAEETGGEKDPFEELFDL